ncbi:MFS transporter [Rugosimonospora acidiphila]|uniref:MFS transporter n=1 Tax=Rugosimonospora acidiphila TaxID=556531 RepID=UPI0031EBBA1D
MTETTYPHRWLVLIFCLFASFMTTLDSTIVVVALPSIGRGIGASTSSLQWVVSGYALAFGVIPILGGRLGDDLGRRRMLLIGIASFVATSAMVGLSPSPGWLDLARVVQGLAAGIINPQISGLVQRLFAPAERGAAFSAAGVSNSIATACGPALAGVVILLAGPGVGWRLLFYINVPIGVLAFTVCRRLLPPDGPPARRPLDIVGVLLLAGALFCTLFPAVQYDNDHDPLLLALLIPAAVLGVSFARWERRMANSARRPLIDLQLFRVRSFVSGLGVALFFFGAFGAAPLVLALYLQDGLGFTAGRSGLVAAGYAAGSVLSAPLAGRLVQRHGRRLSVFGLCLFGLGMLLLATTVAVATRATAPHTIGLLLIGPLVLAGLGGGCVSNPNQAMTLAEVNVGRGSTAGGMLQTSQRLGSALGVAGVSTVFYALTSHAPAAGAAHRVVFGHAYASSIGIAVVFALGAMVFALSDQSRRAGVS